MLDSAEVDRQALRKFLGEDPTTSAELSTFVKDKLSRPDELRAGQLGIQRPGRASWRVQALGPEGNYCVLTVHLVLPGSAWHVERFVFTSPSPGKLGLLRLEISEFGYY